MLRNIVYSFYASLLLLLSSTAYSLSAQSILHHAGDPSIGNPKGNVTVMEFFDYQCSHCAKMAAVIENIAKKNPNVRIVFKEYPIRGAASEFAARAALAANKQRKYYRFSHALLTTDLSLTPATILDIAQQQGIDTKRLQKDMKSKYVYNEINNNYALARALNINGTPSFIITKSNTKNMPNIQVNLGELSESELQAAINQANS